MRQCNRRRIAAAVFCLLFCFALAFSIVFIAAEAHHDCTGDKCPICAEMQVCANLLHTGALITAAAAISAAVYLLLGPLLWAYDAPLFSFTLVSLKVKLSD